MVAVEVLTAVLVLALAIVTTAVFYVGLLGAVGLIRYVQCDHCGHLGLTSASEPLRYASTVATANCFTHTSPCTMLGPKHGRIDWGLLGSLRQFLEIFSHRTAHF